MNISYTAKDITANLKYVFDMFRFILKPKALLERFSIEEGKKRISSAIVLLLVFSTIYIFLYSSFLHEITLKKLNNLILLLIMQAFIFFPESIISIVFISKQKKKISTAFLLSLYYATVAEFPLFVLLFAYYVTEIYFFSLQRILLFLFFLLTYLFLFLLVLITENLK